ncbi:MAG TPA: hypothetical protein VNU92_11595 [Edaphobacter sp.]|jgi:hypothetical protein|nr:hypothetical protein [Edaphobacter sp.]
MNTALAYLTYALVIAVPAGLLFTGLIPLVRRLQLSFQPNSAHIPETQTDRTVAQVYAQSESLRRALESFRTVINDNAVALGTEKRVQEFEKGHFPFQPEKRGSGNPKLANAGVADQIKGAALEHWGKGRVHDDVGIDDKGRVHDDAGIDPYSVKGRIRSQAEERRRDH